MSSYKGIETYVWKLVRDSRKKLNRFHIQTAQQHELVLHEKGSRRHTW